MKYTYKAKDKGGKLARGTIEAADEKTAIQSLKDTGLFVIDLKASKKSVFGGALFQKRVSLKDKIIFTQQLAMMIRSGLSITEALEALKQEAQNQYFAGQIMEITATVKGGTPLSDAFGKFPDTFNDIYINMTRSGESSGKIDAVLDRLANQLEKDYELTRKIRGALAYPLFVVFVLIIVMILVITIIIPQLKIVFDDAGVELPLLTRIVIAISNGIRQYWPIILGILIVIGGGIFWQLKAKKGRNIYDKTIVKVPVFGDLLKKTYVSRFARTFSSLVSSGLPIIDSINVSSRVIGNSVYESELAKISDEVRNGKQISDSLRSSHVFPLMLGQLASVGEKSGNLDEVFAKIADFFDRDIENITANLSQLLEPVLMVFMGIGIGLVIVSILQPIYGLVNAI
jgi:type IV pilus assembly protein PilC